MKPSKEQLSKLLELWERGQCSECGGFGKLQVTADKQPTGLFVPCEACKGTGRRYQIALVDMKAELPGWQHYTWPRTRRDDNEMARYQTGKITKEKHHELSHKTFEEEFAIYKKSQQDMAGFVKEVME